MRSFFWRIDDRIKWIEGVGTCSLLDFVWDEENMTEVKGFGKSMKCWWQNFNIIKMQNSKQILIAKWRIHNKTREILNFSVNFIEIANSL